MNKYKVNYTIGIGDDVQTEEISADQVGVTETNHLVFDIDGNFVAVFADGYWINFKKIGEDGLVSEELVPDTIVEEVIEEPVVEEPVVEEEFIEEIIEIEVMEDTPENAQE